MSEYLCKCHLDAGRDHLALPRVGVLRREDRLQRRGQRVQFAPDGRFIGVVDAPQAASGSDSDERIDVVLNWTEELKRLAPPK